ncbi:DMT family transporter [Catenuloplanes atrovinosus]|nr:EamA family transporter [Catenuloplanes atrovinosus]
MSTPSPMPRVPAWRGMALIALAAVAWGTGGAVAAVLYRTSGLGPIAVSYWRFLIGAVALAVYVSLRRTRRVPRDPARRYRRLLAVLATGAGLAVYQSAFYLSIAHSGLAVATVVTLGAGPILIAIGARAFLAERLGHAGAAAITLALSGLVALSLDGGATGPNPALGLACALLSALGYAVVTLVGRTADAAGDPFRTSLSGFLVGGVVLTPFALAEGVLPTAGGLGVTIGWLLYLGVVASALAYGLFFAGLAHVSATTAAIVTLLEPVAAAILAVGFLGEHLSPAVLTGMLLLVGAVAVLTRPARR